MINSSPRRRSSLLLSTCAATLMLSALPTAANADDASSWPQFGRTPRHLGVNAQETAFTPANIGNLAVAWRGRLPDSTANTSGAVVAGGFAYVGGTDGQLSVFAADGCGDDICDPVWIAKTHNGIYDTPAVVDGVVYVGSADHHLYAYDADGCGETQCDPIWRGQLQDAALDSSPAVANNSVYLGDYGGHLYAFPKGGCGHATCAPTWVGAAAANEEFVSAPAVAGGRVFIGTFLATDDLFDGRLLAFDADGCGATPVCSPTWTAPMKGPVGDSRAPLVWHGKVYVGSSTRFGDKPNGTKHLYAFRAAGCGHPSCQPLWSYRTDDQGVVSGPSLQHGTLYASVQATPNPNTSGVVAAFPARGCGHPTCGPLWTGVNFAAGFESSPVLTGGLVMVAKGPASGFPVDAAVFAYDAGGCGQSVCQPLVLAPTSDQQNYSGAPLAVADGTIFMVSNDSNGPSYVYAFTVT